ncbi:MAG: MgtC/SapB family protein [Patescibacteria group bacterium]
MLTLEQMLLRLGLAVLLGIIIGLEREIAGKEAGLRTDMMVAAGAAIFTIAGLSLPYLVAVSPENLPEIIARNSGFLTVIANIIIGVGFLGTGIIVKYGIHVRGLTTAATVWFVAAIGVLCGIGLTAFAVISGIGLTVILEIFRRANIGGFYGKSDGSNS